MSTLPTAFIESLSKIMNQDETPSFIEALNSPVATSIRVNPYKLNKKPNLEPVSWTNYGFYLSERESFTLDPLFHAGEYYVQESSSMFVEYLFRHVFSAQDQLTILDLCASPGGKTTLLSSIAGVESVIHANEVIRTRAQILADNVKKWGLGNVVVTNNDPSHFEATKEFYDLILVDAPCSGEGMFRKDAQAREQWSESSVELCAARQKRILSEVWNSLKPGGVMIYSTCTFNEKENEENIKWLTEQYDCSGIDIPVDDSWGIIRTKVEDISCFRFYPNKVKGEGFFCSILQKGHNKIRTKLSKPRRAPFSQIPNKLHRELAAMVNQGDLMQFSMVGDKIYGYYQHNFNAIRQICERYSVVYSGVEMGQFFGNKFKGEHPLALFHDINKNYHSLAHLELEQAQDYLRKNDLSAHLFCEGTNLVCYNNSPLGWAKRISNRVNNMYPKELRILHL